MTKPKAILFDIGGVCVVSPFEAIVQYEAKNGIPKDFINFSIARSAPNGAWQRLERGEVNLDEQFFDAFRRDLHQPALWQEYHQNFKHRHNKKSLKDVAAANATQLGDPVSLKAETSTTIPTPDEKGAAQSDQGGRQRLKDVANKSMLGDPVSLKAESSERSPLPDDSGAPSSSAATATASGLPPLPKIDSTALFWDMMARSRTVDPHMFPALMALRKSGQYTIAALSNTVIFPADHEYSKEDVRNLQAQFDMFISSAEIGLRKPDPEIYKYALEKLDRLDKDKGGNGVKPDQVVFLDDIGANLRPARELGFQTIKVNLGRVNEAVKQLEDLVGMRLNSDKGSRL